MSASLPGINSLRFAGYAALFDIPDADRDVLRKGAFAKTLAAKASPMPLLWQHRASQPLGEIEYVAEDTRGLRVIARINRPVSRAARLLNEKAVSGLSFGYRALSSRTVGDMRELLEVDLFEVSLVIHPLHPLARVHLID